MRGESYESKLFALQQTYTIEKEEFYKSDHFNSYMAVSSSLSLFLPEIDRGCHHDIVLDLFFNRDLSYIDQFYPSKILGDLTIADESLSVEASREQAQIFVTYHTGSYRTFIHHLIDQDIPFCLVTQQYYIEKYGELSQNIVKKAKQDGGSSIDIISAEDPRLLFQLKKKIHEGISVVFYIDGNTGVSQKENSENKNLSEIDFLNHKIYARQGVAFLAYITKAPIVTVLCERLNESKNRLTIQRLDQEIEDFEGRNEFIEAITKQLYDYLAAFLKVHPEQWEGWLYLDKFFNREAIKRSSEILNSNNVQELVTFEINLDEDVELFSYDDRFFVALKRDMRVLELDEQKYNTIKCFEKTRFIQNQSSVTIEGREFSWVNVAELINYNILKATSRDPIC